jgi:hypothetical protein
VNFWYGNLTVSYTLYSGHGGFRFSCFHREYKYFFIGNGLNIDVCSPIYAFDGQWSIFLVGITFSFWFYKPMQTIRVMTTRVFDCAYLCFGWRRQWNLSVKNLKATMIFQTSAKWTLPVYTNYRRTISNFDIRWMTLFPDPTPFRVVIPGVRRPFGGRTGQAGRPPCPLCLIWTGRGTVDGEITIPNLLYCGNFSYCWQPTWQWTIWGGSPRNYVGRKREQLRAHARTGMGANMLGANMYWAQTCRARTCTGREHVGRQHVPGANMYRAPTCRAPT